MTETREAPTTASRSGTYRAAVVHNFGEPLTLEQIPALPLEPGQMRVKVEAGKVAARVVFQLER